LIALLTDDPDPVVSAEAATLLGAIGNDVAVLRALSGALEDRRLVHMRPVVADAAAKALERRGWR
jgi:HEAT repeat protein